MEEKIFGKMILTMLALLLSLLAAGVAPAHEGEGGIPEQVTSEHWAYKEVSELGEKYGAAEKLPKEGYCPRMDLARCLLAILDTMVEKHEKEGTQAIDRHDIGRMAALRQALEAELVKFAGYHTRRETIERVLALIEAEEPPFEYKVGLKGFLRGEGVNDFRLTDFSYSPRHGEGRFLYRIQPYAYWHPTDYLDIHLEGQGYGFYRESYQRSSKFSLYQGFAEAKPPGKDWIALKAGRQEFGYGSTFILGPDSFYDGLSFDGARLRLRPLADLTVDLFGGRYATPFSDGLEGSLTGAYVTYAPSEKGAVEAYMFRDTGSSDHHAGERLDIWGLRGTARLGPFGLEIEPVYESGRVFNPAAGANEKIGAYGGHIDLTGEVALAGLKNKFFLSYAIGSGSREAANGITSGKEFRNPNNDTSLVGDMNVIGDLSGVDVAGHRASGLQVYSLGWGIDVTNKLSFSATGKRFAANHVEKGFSRHLGLEADFNVTYAINNDVSLILACDRFFTGKFFREASGSGRDITYAYAMLVFNLDKTKPKRLRK